MGAISQASSDCAIYHTPMSTTGISSSLLNAYDPTNPSSLDSALSSAGVSDAYYQDGVNGTDLSDPGVNGPTGASISVAANNALATAASSSGPNIYQQALASLQEWSDQTLITGALSGPSSITAAPDDSSAVTSSLEAAAEAQQSAQAAQQQSALAAAQAALSAGQNVDTTA
jgi:hypothetical protein